jgi:aspartyl-tRNA(Asn)/glutamyl-tRNA(Gln) amidotransferase subunit C
MVFRKNPLKIFMKKGCNLMKKITKEEVEHITHLARLTLSESELEKVTVQLDTILSYVEKLDELETADIRPTTHVFSVTNAFREDIVEDSLPREKALANAPLQDGENFQVPKII